uniref:Uncharacterized protein n=1 Tax=Nannospalax galili TaxID=1026970 RepID=A0A8C6RFQ9_NANGA
MKKAEMGRFSISPDEDSSSYSSNSDFNYSYPTKQAALKSHYADVDPENQNFLLESNLGKKKYETDFNPLDICVNIFLVFCSSPLEDCQ